MCCSAILYHFFIVGNKRNISASAAAVKAFSSSLLLAPVCTHGDTEHFSSTLNYESSTSHVNMTDWSLHLKKSHLTSAKRPPTSKYEEIMEWVTGWNVWKTFNKLIRLFFSAGTKVSKTDQSSVTHAIHSLSFILQQDEIWFLLCICLFLFISSVQYLKVETLLRFSDLPLNKLAIECMKSGCRTQIKAKVASAPPRDVQNYFRFWKSRGKMDVTVNRAIHALLWFPRCFSACRWPL